jgi:glutamate racemase
VRGGAYQRAIATLRPDARVTAVACQLFVALAEEGWISGEVVEATITRYLRPMFGAAMSTTMGTALGGKPTDASTPDAVVLGCTHFPVLRAAIAAAVGPSVALVDSAATTALAARERLVAGGLCGVGPGVAQVRFLATDSAERFAAVGSRFLGREIHTAEVELIDL